MRGVPENLSRALPVGQELVRVSIGRYQVQLHFSGQAILSIEGKWTLESAAQGVIETHLRDDACEATQLPILLHKKVITSKISPPTHFSLDFEGGSRLTVFDDSELYESFSIGGFFV